MLAPANSVGHTWLIAVIATGLDFSYFGGAESLDEGRSPRRTEVHRPTAQDDGKAFPGPPQDPSDFLRLMTEEPHRPRRMAIMKAHPEVGIALTPLRHEIR